MGAWTDICPASSVAVLRGTGNERMTCPARGRFAAIDHQGNGLAPVVPLTAASVHQSRVPGFMWCGRPEAQRRHATRRQTVCRGLTRGIPPLWRGASPFHSLSHLLCAAVFCRPGTVSASGQRILSGGTVLLPTATERVSHVQQNAYRCVSPGRNKGGGPSR